MEKELQKVKDQAAKVKPETNDIGRVVIQDNTRRLEEALNHLLEKVKKTIDQLDSCLQTQSGLEEECKVLSDWLEMAAPILKAAEVPCDDIEGKATANAAVEVTFTFIIQETSLEKEQLGRTDIITNLGKVRITLG